MKLAPFGTYGSVSNINNAARTSLSASLAALKNLIPDPSTGIATTYAPDFDEIPPHTAQKIRAELDSVVATITAAPTTVSADLP